MLPVVASIDWTKPALDRASGFVNELAALDATAPAYAPKFFSAHEWKTLRVIADVIIPKDEHSGSATDAKAPEFIDFMMMDKETSEATKTFLRGCLAWMDNESRRRFGVDFITATGAQHREIFDDIAFPKKAKPEMARGVAVFNRLRDSIASAFYSSAMGWQDLRYIGNVFNPNWNGCPPAATQKLGVSYDEYDASLKSQRAKRGA
ncbi:MAG: hypothetical protein JWO05_1420 [Gemmatimonadetes bacterium]|nr:hypothetical protein [Gemmatimonadota bacterium]